MDERTSFNMLLCLWTVQKSVRLLLNHEVQNENKLQYTMYHLKMTSFRMLECPLFLGFLLKRPPLFRVLHVG